MLRENNRPLLARTNVFGNQQDPVRVDVLIELYGETVARKSIFVVNANALRLQDSGRLRETAHDVPILFPLRFRPRAVAVHRGSIGLPYGFPSAVRLNSKVAKACLPLS